MNWYDTVFELIDMRSFSNLWFWIALAVVWSTASHWVIGVPFDMVQRAMRPEANKVGDQDSDPNGNEAANEAANEAMSDLENLTRIYTNRLVFIGNVSGLWILGLACAALTGMALLGFWYWVEFAQALFLLGFPLSLVGGLSLLTANKIQAGNMAGEALCKQLKRHRLYTQIIGLLAIFVTAMWGMYQNMSVGALGG